MGTNDNMQGNYDILLLCPDRKGIYRVDNAPSYGHICISRYIAKSGFTSRIYGGSIQGCCNMMQDAVNGKTRIVGFGCLQDNYMVAVHAARLLKQCGITVIFGGPQAVSMGEEEIRSWGVDFVSVGEGEITIDLLLRYLLREEGSLSEIRGIRYVDDEGVYHDTGYPEVVKDLDIIPVADATDVRTETNTLMIMSGRGCPFSCAFCYEGTTKGVRFRSVKNVMAEIDAHLRRSKTTPHILFMDDTFTLNPGRVRQFCQELKARNLKWACEAHVGTLAKTPELIDEMVASGLTGVQIGIESGNPDVLRAYNKNITPEQIIDIVKRFKKVGCQAVDGNFIVGGALETPETLEDSIKLAEKLIEIGHMMTNIHTVFYAPYPGTAISRCPDKYGIQLMDNAHDYMLDSMRVCVNRTDAMTREQIQEGKRLFDERIKNKYLSEIEELTYTELLKFLPTHDPKRGGGKLWFTYINEVETVYRFMRCGFHYQNLGDYDSVPVRTFSDLKYDNGALRVGKRLFFGDEKTFLERANGSVTFREMKDILGVATIFHVMNIYKKLRENLLVYMERF